MLKSYANAWKTTYVLRQTPSIGYSFEVVAKSRVQTSRVVWLNPDDKGFATSRDVMA
jgi:hypothetical protein